MGTQNAVAVDSTRAQEQTVNEVRPTAARAVESGDFWPWRDHPTMAQVMAAESQPKDVAFAHWLANADPGDAIRYFVGDLATARTKAREIFLLSQAAWNAHREGKVRLFQKRGMHGFAYFAVKA